MSGRARVGAGVVLAAVGVVGLGGCDKLRGGLGSSGGGSGSGSGPATSARGGTATGPAGCAVPEDRHVTKSWAIPGKCSLVFPDDLTVDDGATLTIGAGAKLAFGSGKVLQVMNGKLVAQGTDAEPVVFTSAATTPAPGDWAGIALGSAISAGTVLDHVVVEYAGNPTRFGTGIATALELDDNPGLRVAVTNSTFRKIKGSAIRNVHENAAFAKLEGNVLGGDEHSLVLAANLLGGVGPNKLEAPIRVEGRVSKTQTWPKVEVPIEIDQLDVRADSGDATLTIAPGTTIKMLPSGKIRVGSGGHGGLIAKSVAFTSGSSSPAPGDWTGIGLYAGTTTAILEGCTVEHAGHAWEDGHVAVFDVDPPTALGKKVQLTKTTIRAVHGPVFGESVECAAAAAPAAGNKAEGVPLCPKR